LLNNHGIVELTKAEATYTFLVPPPKPSKNETNTTETETTKNVNTEQKENDEETSNTNTNTNTKPTPSDPSEEKSNQEEKDTDDDDESNDDGDNDGEVQWVKKQKKVTLSVESVSTGFPPLNPTQFSESVSRLAALDRKDKERRETDEAKNSLESYIYSQRERLYEDEVLSYSTEEERTQLSDQLEAASTWLYEEEGASAIEYRKRLRQLRQVGDRIEFRIHESTTRPEALRDIHGAIPFTHELILNASQIRNISDEDLAEADELFGSIISWLTVKEKEQEAKKPYEDPVLTSTDIRAKLKKIEKLALRLIRKPLKKKPTPTPTPTQSTPSSDTDDDTPISPSPSPTPSPSPVHSETESSKEQAINGEANNIHT